MNFRFPPIAQLGRDLADYLRRRRMQSYIDCIVHNRVCDPRSPFGWAIHVPR